MHMQMSHPISFCSSHVVIFAGWSHHRRHQLVCRLASYEQPAWNYTAVFSKTVTAVPSTPGSKYRLPDCCCRVTLSDLLAATSTCAKRYFLCAHVHTTGNGRQPVVHGPRRMQLHPCFANSLRLAQVSCLLPCFLAVFGCGKCGLMP